MLITKEMAEKRIQELQVAFTECVKNQSEIMGALKECQSILQVINKPEPPLPLTPMVDKLEGEINRIEKSINQ
jgi:hypothetical protein